jgi:hypothetical protein
LVSSAAVLEYVASAILIAWGVVHLAPTRAVAGSFGEDLARQSARPWLWNGWPEGITHISIGFLVILATAIEGGG